MKYHLLALLVFGCLASQGCSGSVLTVGAYDDPPRLAMDGWVTGYAAIPGIRPYDGTIIRLDIFEDCELIMAEVWPLAEAGIGFVGARLRILPLEIALATLCYEPQPPDYWDGEEAEIEEEPVTEDAEPGDTDLD